jgi:hypothetical protein
MVHLLELAARRAGLGPAGSKRTGDRIIGARSCGQIAWMLLAAGQEGREAFHQVPTRPGILPSEGSLG